MTRQRLTIQTEQVSKEVAKELIDAFDGEVVVVVSGSGLSDPDKVNEMLKRRPRAIHAEQCGMDEGFPEFLNR